MAQMGIAFVFFHKMAAWSEVFQENVSVFGENVVILHGFCVRTQLEQKNKKTYYGKKQKTTSNR
jgi:hypothetical protein